MSDTLICDCIPISPYVDKMDLYRVLRGYANAMKRDPNNLLKWRTVFDGMTKTFQKMRDDKLVDVESPSAPWSITLRIQDGYWHFSFVLRQNNSSLRSSSGYGVLPTIEYLISEVAYGHGTREHYITRNRREKMAVYSRDARPMPRDDPIVFS